MMSGLSNGIFREEEELPYTLEVPVNKIRAVKILHPLRAVDQLQGPSVFVSCREKSPVQIACVENHCV